MEKTLLALFAIWVLISHFRIIWLKEKVKENDKYMMFLKQQNKILIEIIDTDDTIIKELEKKKGIKKDGTK